MDTTIFEQVDQYIGQLLAPEDTALQHTIQATTDNDIPFIQISPTQGKLLQVFAAMCNAKNILELGTLAGYSTIWLARAIPDDGKVITLEYEPKHADVARQNLENAGLLHKVDIRTGAALDILPQLAAEDMPPFDFVFIDADKPPYLEYFQWAIKLCRPGSIIVADNVIRNGLVLDPDSDDDKVRGVQRLNSWLADCKEVTSIILPTIGVKEFDGMVVSVVK